MGQSRSAGCSSGVWAGIYSKCNPSGIFSFWLLCQPALSRTNIMCLFLLLPKMFSLVGQHLVKNSNIDQGLEPPVSLLQTGDVQIHRAKTT